MAFGKRIPVLPGPVTLAMPGLGTVLGAVSRAEAHHAEDLAAQPGKWSHWTVMLPDPLMMSSTVRTSKKTWDSSIDSPSLVDQLKKNISKFRSSGISWIYHQFWGRLPIVINVRAGLPDKTSWLDMITVAMDVPLLSGSDQNLVNPDLPAICGQLSMVDHRSLTGRSWHRNIELCRPVGHGSSIGKSNLECGAIANNRAYYKTNARWIE